MKAVYSSFLIIAIAVGLWETGQQIEFATPDKSQPAITDKITYPTIKQTPKIITSKIIRASQKSTAAHNEKSSHKYESTESSLEDLEDYINRMENPQQNSEIPYYELESNNPPAPYIPLTAEQKAYKQSVLMRLHARNSNKSIPLQGSLSNDQNDSSSNSGLDETLITADDINSELENRLSELATDFEDYEQFKSETTVENSDNFNFSQQKLHPVAIESRGQDGEVMPYTKFIIENSAGNIILESCTNSQGQFTTNLKKFERERLYLRFFSSGLNQDRILLNGGK